MFTLPEYKRALPSTRLQVHKPAKKYANPCDPLYKKKKYQYTLASFHDLGRVVSPLTWVSFSFFPLNAPMPALNQTGLTMSQYPGF